MNLSSLIITGVALILGSLSVCIYVRDLATRRRLQVLDRGLQQLQGLLERIDALETRLAELHDGRQPSPATPFTAIQASDRARVFELRRLGKTDDEIATKLCLPNSTIRMMLKIMDLGSRPWPGPQKGSIRLTKFDEQSRVVLDKVGS